MLLLKDIIYDARVQREAQALAENGFEITIFCVKEFQQSPPDIHKNITIIRHELFNKQAKMSLESKNIKKTTPRTLLKKVVRLPLVKIVKDIMMYRQFYQKIRADLQNIQIDVIHCHDLNTLTIGYYLSRRYQTKLVYDSHELFNEMAGRSTLEKYLGYYIERRYIQRVDHLIVVNPYVQQEFEKRYGKRPTTTIQNIPVINRSLMKIEERNYWRELFQMSDKDMILLYQGGINPNRGVEDCIKAVANLPEQYKLILLGSGSLTSNLKKVVKESGLEQKVFFHDQVESSRLLWYTKQADIGLVMYKSNSKNNYYSTPNKVFEYLLAGIPMITSDHPGKRFLIDNYNVGVCAKENVASIQEAILTLTQNYDYYKENCLQNRDAVSWDQEGLKLVALYNKLISIEKIREQEH